jgi:hypothetical protein
VIVHVTLTKYRPTANGRSKQENMAIARRMIDNITDEISSIRYMEVGVSKFSEPGGFDTASYSEYEDIEAAQRTIAHPAHDRLTSFLAEVTETRHSVTYEVTRKTRKGDKENAEGG